MAAIPQQGQFNQINTRTPGSPAEPERCLPANFWCTCTMHSWINKINIKANRLADRNNRACFIHYRRMRRSANFSIGYPPLEIHPIQYHRNYMRCHECQFAQHISDQATFFNSAAKWRAMGIFEPTKIAIKQTMNQNGSLPVVISTRLRKTVKTQNDHHQSSSHRRLQCA